MSRDASRRRGRIVTTLQPFFDSEIAVRGAGYFRRGAVELIEGTDRGVSARVNGSAAYNTGLWCEGSSYKQAVYLWCDCPFVFRYNQPCKHLWAVIQLRRVLKTKN